MSEADATGPIPDDRPLTAHERRLVEHLLDMAGAEGRAYLSQLARARVRSRCACGCASIDLAIAGEPEPSGGLQVISDYLFDDHGKVAGIFVFAQEDILSGLEVYPMAGDTPRTLPALEAIRTSIYEFPGWS